MSTEQKKPIDSQVASIVTAPFYYGKTALASQTFSDGLHAVLPGVLSVTGGSLARHYTNFSSVQTIFDTPELKSDFILGELLGTVIGFLTYSFVIAKIVNVDVSLVAHEGVRNLLNDFVRWATVLSFIQLFTSDPELLDGTYDCTKNAPFMKLTDPVWLKSVAGWFLGLTVYHIVVNPLVTMAPMLNSMTSTAAKVRDSAIKFSTVFGVQEFVRTYKLETAKFGDAFWLQSGGFITGLVIYDVLFSDVSIKMPSFSGSNPSLVIVPPSIHIVNTAPTVSTGPVAITSEEKKVTGQATKQETDKVAPASTPSVMSATGAPK